MHSFINKNNSLKFYFRKINEYLEFRSIVWVIFICLKHAVGVDVRQKNIFYLGNTT